MLNLAVRKETARLWKVNDAWLNSSVLIAMWDSTQRTISSSRLIPSALYAFCLQHLSSALSIATGPVRFKVKHERRKALLRSHVKYTSFTTLNV